MNISYGWLNELIELELSVEDTASALTRVGLAVEGTHAFGDDRVFDIDLTSNRPDCLSHLGVTRELRVITGKTFSANEESREDEAEAVPLPSLLAADVVKIEDPELCYRFTARIIRGVKIGPSPEWLVKRLEALGERSINNVADITNYVMLELGQPMHAFDLDKLAGNRIIVRRAKADETITTLDEVERKLDPSMLMICDPEKPVAVGGVMGGLDSSITDDTVNVLLEVAYFDRSSIRQTSRKLGLATEASYRFERGVDIENLKRASDRAAELIRELAGGTPDDFIDVYPKRIEPVAIVSNDISAAVKRLTGLEVDSEECLRILESLGFEADTQTEGGSAFTFTAPTWRHDIAIEEDLVEEVARHAGYENIAEELPPAFGAGEYQASEVRKKLLRQRLTDMGFDEAICYSFIDTRFDEQYQNVPGLLDEKVDDKFVTLQDSVIEGAVRMRPSLLPGLLESIRSNLNYQRRDLKLFEIGKVFAAKSGESSLPTERELFGIAITGGELLQKQVEPARSLDFYDAKGAVEAAFDAVGFPAVDFRAAVAAHLQPGQTAGIFIDGGLVGYLGRLSESISQSYKFRSPVYVAEFDLDAVLARNTSTIAYRPLPKYPSVTRDVSFIVGRDVSFDDVRETVIDAGFEICRNVGFVDLFEGKGFEPGKRSLTVRLEYRSDERTLIEDEVAEAHAKILDAVREGLGILPRV